MSWHRLARAYRSRGLVLVLGAGVSIGSADEPMFPSWPELLRRIAERRPDRIRGATTDELVAAGFTLPMIASLLHAGRSPLPTRPTDERPFLEDVREALYRDFDFYPHGLDKSNRRRLVALVKQRNATLRAVAALCAAKAPGQSVYVANPRIGGVVSFNLDALLQTYVYARYEKRLLRTVERAAAGSRSDKISTYHVHGYLRYDRLAGNQEKESDQLVLTEREYFDFFNSPNTIFNYALLYLLREYPCLFVGLSMRDENLRRVMHLSVAERVRALEAEGVAAEKIAAQVTRHYAVMLRTHPSVDRAVEDSLRTLGTRTLWIDDFEEIPTRFGEIYDSTSGAQWADVF